ncbi:MAG: urease accessory protein UreD [Gammaproteobacteria bacterium]|nr:urease accessory protein UreD [Gammaproteobacteria bacterium]
MSTALCPDLGMTAARRWPAALHLHMAVRDGATRLISNRHHGPLRVQRPFYPEGPEICHVYVLHPPGGLVSGDDLHLNVHADAHSRTLITTPSAGKVYRVASTGEAQTQRTHLTLAPGAVVEWLPQDTIIYNGANGRLELTVDLAPGARFFGWEMLCLGRRAGNHPFDTGYLEQRLHISRAGEPCLIERMPILANPTLREACWGLAGHTVIATALASVDHLDASTRQSLVEGLREHLRNDALAGKGIDWLGITCVRGLLILRAMHNDAELVRHHLVRAWHWLRPRVLDREPESPRIWAT